MSSKEAKDGEVDFYDASHEKEIKTRAQVRLDLWALHLKNLTGAVAEAMGKSVPSEAW